MLIRHENRTFGKPEDFENVGFVDGKHFETQLFKNDDVMIIT